MEYRQTDEAIRTAWFAYCEACRSLCRQPTSCVDFVAGYNAALAQISKESITLGESTADCY